MYKTIVYFVLLIFLVGCSQQPHQVLLHTLKEDPRLFCPVTINGLTFNFLLDTGSDQTIIDYSRASKAGLLPTDSCLQSIDLLDRTWKDSLYKADINLKIANMSFRNKIVLDNYKTSLFDFKHYDGVLGMDILSQISWIIDLEKNMLLLYACKVNIPKDVTIDLALEADNLIYVDIVLGGSIQKVMLDTGCPIPLCIGDYEFLPELALTNDLLNQCKKDTVRMVFIEVENRFLMLYDNLEIGKINLPYALMDNALRNNSSGDKAFLTKSMLDHFDYMIYDMQKEQVYLCGYDGHIARTEDMSKIYSKIREGYQKGTISKEIFKR